jgi:hypothetical protein
MVSAVSTYVYLVIRGAWCGRCITLYKPSVLSMVEAKFAMGNCVKSVKSLTLGIILNMD